MKALFSIAIGSALIATANAQLQAPPPITTAPPPAVPNPGIAVGATGGLSPGTTTGSTVVRRTGTNPVFTTPFPVVVPPNTPLFPEPIDPLELVLESDMLRMLQQSPPTPNPAPAQGRPGGLGVTITGGSTNPPPSSIPVATNTPPVTNAVPPPNAAGAGVPNPAYP